MSAALVAICAGRARAAGTSEYRWGFSAGFGGTGITATQTLTNGATGTVPRSEGPVVMSIFVDTLLSDTWGLAFEHSRGVNFLPFSSGVSFTGVVSRWYFWGPAPFNQVAEGGSTILIKRFVPFLGFAAGLAEANVQRDAGDNAPVVSGSGVFFGARIGADYSTGIGKGIRPEIVASSSQFASSFSTAKTTSTPPLLQEFALQCSWYYNF